MTVDLLREFCLSLSAASEDIKWGNDLVFSVGSKMFCVTSLDPPVKFSFKVKDEEFEELSMQEGFIPAPYMARAKWVLVTEPNKLSKKIWQDYVKSSYEMVKLKLTKKQKLELGI